MPSYSGGPSHGNTSSSDQWSSLATLMVQVENIMTTLDDYTQHTTLNDKTISNFVLQLNGIKDKIPHCAPPRSDNKVTPMIDCLRDACKNLNLAAIEYQQKKRLNSASYNYIMKGHKSLSQVIGIWQRIRKSG